MPTICRHFGTYFFGRLFLSRSFLYRASRLTSSSFDTLNTWRIALSNLSNSVFPGTFGAGSGFTRRLYRQKQPSDDLLGCWQRVYNRAAFPCSQHHSAHHGLPLGRPLCCVVAGNYGKRTYSSA